MQEWKSNANGEVLKSDGDSDSETDSEDDPLPSSAVTSPILSGLTAPSSVTASVPVTPSSATMGVTSSSARLPSSSSSAYSSTSRTDEEEMKTLELDPRQQPQAVQQAFMTIREWTMAQCFGKRDGTRRRELEDGHAIVQELRRTSRELTALAANARDASDLLMDKMNEYLRYKNTKYIGRKQKKNKKKSKSKGKGENTEDSDDELLVKKHKGKKA